MIAGRSPRFSGRQISAPMTTISSAAQRLTAIPTSVSVPPSVVVRTIGSGIDPMNKAV